MESPEMLHYRKRPGAGGIAGQLYEVKMCSVVFVRGVRDGEFHLASNIDHAGAFDDLGLRLCQDDGSHRISLVQLKHKLNSEKTITRKQLLSHKPTGNFGLLKYFLSYRKHIKPQFLSCNSNDPLFGSSLNDLSLVFYTNASIAGMPEASDLKDDILSTGRDGRIYKFNKDRDKDVWNVWDEWCKLVPDLGDISEYEEFLSKLVLYTKQATESELDLIIKMELIDILNITPEISDVLLSKCLTQLQMWWGNDDGEYLTQKCTLWGNMIEDTLRMINEGTKRELLELDFRCSDDAVVSLSECLEKSRVILCLVESKTTRLSLCKVTQVLERNRQGYVLGNSEAALGFWHSCWCSTLVLEGRDCNSTLLSNCICAVEMCPNKKLLVVVSENNQMVINCLRGFEHPGLMEFKDKINLLCMDSPSIHKMLVKEVNFQGHNVLLTELITEYQGKKINSNVDSLLQSLNKLSHVLKYSQNEIQILEKFNTDTFVKRINSVLNGRKIIQESDMDALVKMHVCELELVKDMGTMSTTFKPLLSLFNIISLIEMVRTLGEELHKSSNLNMFNNDINVTNVTKLIGRIPKEKDLLELGQHWTSIDTLVWWERNEKEMRICLQKIMSRHKDLVCTILPILEELERRSMFKEGNELKDIFRTLTYHLADNPMKQQVMCQYLNTISSLDILLIDIINDSKCLGAIVSELTLMEALNGDMLLSMLKGDIICLGVPLEAPVTYYIPRSLKREKVVAVEIAADVEDRVTVIAAEPGMGKTTLLTQVAHQTKTKEPSMWVMTVIMNRMTSYLKSIQSLPITKDIALNLLRLSADVKHPFERKLIDHMWSYTGRIIVFLDGFDEVCPHYKDTMIKIISELSLTEIQKLWISSRPYLKCDLETCTQSRVFDIVEFSEEDQICFLRKVWSERVINLDETYLSTFILDVIRQVSHSLSDTERSFMGLPLQTLLVAEVFERELSEGHTKSKLLPILFNVNDLFERFFLKKCDIYFEQKEGVDTSKRGFITEYDQKIMEIEEYHEYAALLSYVSKDELIYLGIKDLADIFMDRYEERWACIGIVTVLDRIPTFFHRTVMEYFVAKWISGHIQICRKLIIEKLFTEEYRVVRSFFDKMLSNGLCIHLDVLDGNVDILVKTVNEVTVNMRDRGGRTPLHLAVSVESSEKSNQIISILLNSGADLDSHDDVLNYSPLEYTDLTRNFSALNMILEISTPALKIKLLQRNNISSIKEACMRGHIAILRYFVRDGFNMNKTVDDVGRRPLHIACKWGQLNVVNYLLDEYRNDMSVITGIIRERIQIQAKDISKRTPLHFACENGEPTIVRLLIHMGCDVNECKHSQETPLHLAAQNGHVHIARILIDAGCKLNVRSISNYTPLLTAVMHRQIEMVRFLLGKSCDSTAGNEDKLTALHFAAQYGYVDIAKLMIEAGCNVDGLDKDLQTPLHYAAKMGHVDIAILLIGSGCKVDSVDRRKRTPLHVAVMNKQLGMVKVLIEEGCNIDACDHNWHTALYVAAENGYFSIANILITAGSNINGCDLCRNTPLGIALSNGHGDIGRLLIETGCNVDSCDQQYSQTLLHTAVGTGHNNIVKALIERGCNVNACDKYLRTPLHLAAEKSDVGIARILIYAGCNVNVCEQFLKKSPLHIAAENGCVELVRVLIQADCNVDICGRFMPTPLHLAVKNGHVDAVRALLAAECNLDACDRCMQTPLHIAVKTGQVDIARDLIEAGSTVDARDSYLKTPLFIAAEMDRAEIASLLIKAGANLDATDQISRTPLRIASENLHVRVVKILIEAHCNLETCHRYWQKFILEVATRGFGDYAPPI